MIRYEDFLHFAESLKDRLPESSDSIEVRTGICRAYYYVFHHIKETFRGYSGIQFKDDFSDHQQVCSIFEEHFGDPLLADRIFAFRDLRNDATYNLRADFDAQDLEDAIAEAKDLAAQAEEYAPRFVTPE